MCRSCSACTELPNDPSLWSREAPLPPPRWFRNQLDPFAESVRAAARGELDRANDILNEVRSNDLRAWYYVHARWSGTKRFELLGRPAPVAVGPVEGQRMPNTAVQKFILERDGYRCRYCGIGVIPKNILFDFGDILATPAFRASTDSDRHGAVQAFRANFDHVTPANLGGSSDAENIVTCCWSCNYGKDRFTVDQIAMDDPRDRQPERFEWRGLIDVAPELADRARFAGKTRTGNSTPKHAS